MYSDDLINTVRHNKHITHVHFTAGGDWFFNAHENDLGLFGRFINGVPELKTKIVKTETREKVLNQEPSENQESQGKPGKKK